MRELLLFYEFFKIGLFSIGGGLATLPFLYRLAEKYDWFTKAMVTDMIAVSESTPGPLGINMATFTGFQSMGVLGALLSTVALMLPSVIIIIWVSRFLEKFRNSPYVERIFYTLRPAVTGLIAAASFHVIINALLGADSFSHISIVNIRIKDWIFFALVLLAMKKWDTHPIVFIALGAVAGILFQF